MKTKDRSKKSKLRTEIVSTIMAFFAILVLTQSGYAIGVTAAQNPETGTYLALGDSLAVGIGTTNPQLLGYVGRFNNFLQLDLTNLAKVGETSNTFISGGQLQNALTTINDPNTNVQVVTLDIGGNDLFALLQGPCSLPSNPSCKPAVVNTLTNFAANYNTILSSLTTALANKPGNKNILVMTYYNPFGGTGNALEPLIDDILLGQDHKIDCSAAVSPANNGLNDIISCTGKAYGAKVVDTYPLIDDKALHLTHIAEGDIHPNNAGYAIIASRFIRASAIP